MLAASKTKIVLLDDDLALLDAAKIYLENKFSHSLLISKFATSQAFIEYLQEHCYLAESPQDILRTFYSGNKTKADIEQTLNDLAKLPAILIVDHQLRDETTNGIEVCKKIRDYFPNSFITLLTAEVDQSNAIKLHNDETIDLFVRKDSMNSMEDLFTHVKKHIEKQKKDCAINPEDAFWFETIIEDSWYCSKRDDFLQQIDYQSYLTISSDGSIAILDRNNNINVYQFSYQGFSING